MGNIVIQTQSIDTFNIADSGSFSGSKKIILNTKDRYVPENIEVTVDANVVVQAGSLNNAAAAGVTYTANTDSSTVIPANGTLYINEGWFPNTMITLGHMIPDDTGYTNAGSGHIRYGFEAYDTDGNKLIGTIPDVTPKFNGGTLTATPAVSNYSAPKVECSGTGKLLPTGTGNVGADFGVTTTAISGTEGTNYLSIDSTHAITNGSVKAKATASGTAVTYNGAATGYINVSGGTTAKDLTSATATSSETTITPTITNSFQKLYIPIVTVEGDGGNVTKSSGSGSVTGTNPNVAISYSGKFTEVGSGGVGANYGVTTTAPSSGTDGTNFLKIVTTATPDAGQTWSGTATINYSRGAVTVKTDAKGIIKMSAGDTLKGSATGSLTHTISGSVVATASGTKTYYIPITSVTHSGGLVTTAASGEEKTAAKSTSRVNAKGKNGSGSSISDLSAYGLSAGNFTSAGTSSVVIYTSASSTTAPVFTVSAVAERAAITYSNAAGAILTHSDETVTGLESNIASDSKDVTGSDVVIDYNSSYRGYKIPIVSPQGTGGNVSFEGSTVIDQEQTTSPAVTISYSGYATSHASDYGIVNSQPTGFVDGDSYVSLVTNNSNTDGTVVGSISGSYNRSDVTANGGYHGLVNLSTSSVLLEGTTAPIRDVTFNPITVQATVSGKKNFYIPVAKYNISGGALSVGNAFTITPDVATKTMTPSTSVFSGTGSGNPGTTAVDSTYGITTTKPDGNWVCLDPVVSDGSKTSGEQTITISGSVGISRAAVTASMTKGITTDVTWQLAPSSTPDTFTGSGSFKYTLATGDNKYIPVVTPEVTVGTHTVTKPTVTPKGTANLVKTGTSSSAPAGVQVLSSAPSDFNSYSFGYIVITPGASTTAGTSNATGKVTLSAGITSGTTGTSSSESSKNVPVTTNNPSDKCYIKVYDNTFSVS